MEGRDFGFYGNGLDGYVHYRQGVNDARESMKSKSAENDDFADVEDGEDEDEEDNEDEDVDNPNPPAEVNQNHPETELQEPPEHLNKQEGCLAAFLIGISILFLLGVIWIIHDQFTALL